MPYGIKVELPHDRIHYGMMGDGEYRWELVAPNIVVYKDRSGNVMRTEYLDYNSGIDKKPVYKETYIADIDPQCDIKDLGIF